MKRVGRRGRALTEKEGAVVVEKAGPSGEALGVIVGKSLSH